MFSVSNTFATIPGIVSPILTGYIVTGDGSFLEWRKVFIIAAGFFLLSVTFYNLWAKAEEVLFLLNNLFIYKFI